MRMILKRNLSRIIGPATILMVALAGLATYSWAQRYELPQHDKVLLQINESRKKHLNPDRISILVWNMQKGIRDSWKNDYQQLSKGKDILLLQEVILDEKMKRTLDKHDDYVYQMAASFKDTWNEQTVTGVATASMAQPVFSLYLRSFHREPLIATPKMAVVTEYLLAGSSKTLLTANIHAINFVSEEKHRHMLGELETLLSAHDGPIILAGDFNTWTDDKTRNLAQMVHRLGLSEVIFSDDVRTRFLGNALDWVFARELSIVSSQVNGSVTGSDHKPMEVVFSL